MKYVIMRKDVNWVDCRKHFPHHRLIKQEDKDIELGQRNEIVWGSEDLSHLEDVNTWSTLLERVELLTVFNKCPVEH